VTTELLEAVKTSDDISEFLTLLFGGETGYVYTATRNPRLEFDNPEYWKQEFFEWPNQADIIVAHLKRASPEYDTYIAPALFSAPDSKKQFVKGANVAWVDFDSGLPSDLTNCPSPSAVVESSNGKQHWYWRLDSFESDIKQIERLNRGLAYMLGADVSGWDANQVLRPPGTRNHKYGDLQQVHLLSITPYAVNPSAFGGLPEPPSITTEFNVTDLQDANLIIAQYQWTKQAFNLYRTLEPADRSAALMQLAYFGAEMGMQDVEIFTLLYHADNRWKKFVGRPDRVRRLNDIIAKARVKHPYRLLQVQELPVFGFKDFLDAEVSIEWVIEDFLEASGQMLLTAKPGVGKSRFTLAFFIHLALGKDFLHYKVSKPQKLVYFSLEMGHAQLLYFLGNMAKSLSAQEITTLQNNLKVVPIGEAVYLGKQAGQSLVEKVLDNGEFSGYAFDSLSRTTPETVNDDQNIKGILDWDASVRNKYGTFSWYIHHNRKASIGNRKPKSLDDILGSTIITANTSAAYTIWSNDPQNKVLDMICVKQRMAEMETPYTISSLDNLMYAEKAIIEVGDNEVLGPEALGFGGSSQPGSPQSKPSTSDKPNFGF
jgi:hypothetical protein